MLVGRNFWCHLVYPPPEFALWITRLFLFAAWYNWWHLPCVCVAVLHCCYLNPLTRGKCVDLWANNVLTQLLLKRRQTWTALSYFVLARQSSSHTWNILCFGSFSSLHPVLTFCVWGWVLACIGISNVLPWLQCKIYRRWNCWIISGLAFVWCQLKRLSAKPQQKWLVVYSMYTASLYKDVPLSVLLEVCGERIIFCSF